MNSHSDFIKMITFCKAFIFEDYICYEWGMGKNVQITFVPMSESSYKAYHLQE